VTAEGCARDNHQVTKDLHVGPLLIAVCLLMAIAAGIITRFALDGSKVAAPWAILRAGVQLAAISTILAMALQQLWSSLIVCAGMFAIASITAARRSQATTGRCWLSAALAVGMVAVIPILLVTGLVPLTGVALVPVFGIVLGGTMTATAMAARGALAALHDRSGEVEASLSLGLSERASRMLVMQRPLTEALIPNIDQARTAGVVTLPGAFVGVLLATGSAVQAGAVQILVLVSLLLAQACAVAVVGELAARGKLVPEPLRDAAGS
jgi:putative ABC transport system permease protein